MFLFYLKEDQPIPTVHANNKTVLVDPATDLVKALDDLRPGKGPQPVSYAGIPREVLVKPWENLGAFRNVRIL